VVLGIFEKFSDGSISGGVRMYFDMIILKRFELRRRDLWEIEVIRLVELLIVEHLFCQIIIIRCVCPYLSIITYLTRMNVFLDICYPSVKL